MKNDMQALEEKASDVADIMRVLGNSARLLVLCHLVEGECSVGGLLARVNLSQSALSQHLAKLRAANLVKTRRDGQLIHYSIADPRLLSMMEALYGIYCAPEAPEG